MRSQSQKQEDESHPLGEQSASRKLAFRMAECSPNTRSIKDATAFVINFCDFRDFCVRLNN